MTITHLPPPNLSVSVAEGGIPEPRAEEMPEASASAMVKVAVPQEPQPSTQNPSLLDLFQTSQPQTARQPMQRAQTSGLMEVVAQVQAAAQAFGTQVRFAVDNESHQIIVQVYDVETKKVIREIPPEQIVNVLSKIMDARDAKGLLLDEQA